MSKKRSNNGNGAVALSDPIRPFPASRKVYVQGSRGDLRVPMREIQLKGNRRDNGHAASGASRFTVYDTSGPYTDRNATPQINHGLFPIQFRICPGAGSRSPAAGGFVPPAQKPVAGRSGWQRDADALCTQRNRHPRNGIHRHSGERAARSVGVRTGG